MCAPRINHHNTHRLSHTLNEWQRRPEKGLCMNPSRIMVDAGLCAIALGR